MKIYLLVSFLIFSSAAFCKSLEDKVLQIEKDISETYAAITLNNASISVIQKQIEQANESIDLKKRYIAKRLLAQKNVKKMSWFLILDSKNKTLFDRNLKIFRNINSFDIENLSEYKLQLEELNDQAQLLILENTKLNELIKILKNKEQDLKFAEQNQIEDLVKTKAIDHLLNFKGKLRLPIQSEIIDRFGSYNNKGNQYVLLVKGLVMNGSTKQPVLTFGPGKVIFSDVIPYWGESLIISHKGGYFSVYSGVENIRVKPNDFVVNEQVIGETNGKDFYFELRHQNIPINPLNWIRKDHDQ